MSQNSNSTMQSTVILQSSQLPALVDHLEITGDQIESGGVLLDIAKRSVATVEEVPNALLQVCQNREGQLTSAYDAVVNRANVESVGASTQLMESINAARDSADQLYHDGIKRLNESFSVAREEIEDESS